MTTIHIPYHKSHLTAEIPDDLIAGVLVPTGNDDSNPDSMKHQIDVVNRALDHPIGSSHLEELAVGKRRCTIITSDHTRPVPSQITLPRLLQRLRRGNPEIKITILIATGFHRASTDTEMREKFGNSLIDNERFVMHDCEDRNSLRQLDSLPSGGELWLNTHALDTDLLIAEGFIEPHFFAGFSGGRKSVLPGIAGRTTVLANHCSKFIADPAARAGCLDGNPIHQDMLFAAKQADLKFILNVTLNDDKSIHGAFAGDPVAAHLAGCREMEARASVPAVAADIVIVGNGGYPLDQNIYQAVKGMTAAEACCRKGGTIIMVAGCSDGHGGDGFYHGLATATTPQALLEDILNIPQNQTPPDQWEYQILARILCRFKVIIVTDFCDGQIIQDMHMHHATSLQQAIDEALKQTGENAKFAIIPDGVSVIVKPEYAMDMP